LKEHKANHLLQMGKPLSGKLSQNLKKRMI